jgi:hypothetical protein
MQYSKLANRKAEIKLYIREDAEIDQEMNAIMKKIKRIEAAAVETEERETYNAIFSKDDSNWEKSLYVLHTTGICATTRAITNEILRLENRQDDKEYNRNLLGNVSSVLGEKAGKLNTIRRYKYKNEWYYGLLEWFDTTGKPKSLYNPNL